MTKRWLGYAVRVALFAAFVWPLYAGKYRPHRDEPFGDVDTEAAVRAANAGHFFQLLYPATDGGRPVLKKMSEIYGDYGIQIVASLTAAAGQKLHGPSFQVQPSLGRDLLMMLFVVTAGAMVVPPVPLLVSVAGVLSLRALFAWGPFVLGPAQHWGVTYVAVLGAVYLGTVLKPWTLPRIAALALLATLAAASQLLRQEAASVSYLVGLALLGAAGVVTIVDRTSAARTEGRLALPLLARRALAGGLLLVAANAAVRPIERWCFSRAWGTPFTETEVAAHGSGWPLYLSLGYVSNPFNIGWRDGIGQVHAALITPGLAYGDPAFQATLLREYEQIVISRPWLLFRNVAAKAARVHELATRRTDPLPGMAVWQTPPLAAFYRAAPWVWLACILLLAWRGTPEGVVVLASSMALVAGASAGALIVFPEYLGGLQGASVAFVLVVPLVVIASMLEDSAQNTESLKWSARRLLAAYGCVVVLIGAGLMAWAGVQTMRYRAVEEATASLDPVAAIASQEFRYAHVFNDLSVGKQGRLVAGLQASSDPIVARHIEDRRGDFSLFRPEVIVRTASQVHLIAWMGRAFVAPVPQLYQGATHSLVLICGDCSSETTVNDYPYDLGWTMINDFEWQGRYRMFSVPLSKTLRAAHFFHVAAERVLALDPTLTFTGLRPGLIASARFSR